MSTGVSYSCKETRPKETVAVATKRMDGFVKEYGRTILCGMPMTLLEFAKSCYLQGCEDMANAVISDDPREPVDFQI